MSNSELLASGLKLLVFGMGWVYVFLVVMIFAINVMSVLLKPFIAKFESKPAASAKPAAPPAAGEVDLVAAAVAAVALRRVR
jgi:oxaloacetate decarboxylase gamma subunit